MTAIVGDIWINRPVEVVFDFVADERDEPCYNPRMETAELVSDSGIGIGSPEIRGRGGAT